MKTSLKHYICGFNGFKQIDLLAKDETMQEHSENVSHQLKEMAAKSGTDTDRTNGKLKLFYSDPQEIDTEIKLCTWSNIWSIKDTGKICCYGNNSSPHMTRLQGERKDSAVTLVQSGEDILLQEAGDNTVLIHDIGKVSKIVANRDHVSLVDSTRECVYGIKDGQCFEGQIKESKEEPEVLMLCLHCITVNIDVQTVSCGFEHLLILTKHGSIYTYGNGSRGQLGHGEVTVDVLKVPKLVETLNGITVVTIAAGGWHSTAVTDTGDIYVWGWNESGQLGLPNGASSPHENLKTNFSYSDADISASGSFAAESEPGKIEILPEYGDWATDNPCIVNEAKITKQEGCKRKFAEVQDETPENTGDICDSKENFYQDSKRKTGEVTEVNTDNKSDQYSLTENVSRNQYVAGSVCSKCVKFYQDLDSVQVQAVPYGLDLPDEMHVKTASCGSRHTCLLTNSGVLLTSGWNNYGQLCHRDTRGRDYFEIVTFFESERVISVTAQCWNTYIRTEKIARVK